MSGVVLAIMSTILGGGMVSIPWATFNVGLIPTIGIACFASAQVVISCVLFLRAREVCPDSPQSMFEMAFLILGRASIFIISGGLFIQSFGLIIIFFNVFGATASSFYSNLAGASLDEPGMMETPLPWIVGLAVLLFPSIFMKELAELKIVSLSLFAAALIFVVIQCYTGFSRGSYEEPNKETQYMMPQEFGSKDFIQSIVIMFTACNFQVNLFPIHSHQIDKSVGATVKYISCSMLLVQSLYFTLAIACILMFGSSIEESVLKNIGEPYGGGVGLGSYICQGLFLVILACHIPYLYYSGKESLLIIIDEIMRKSISMTLAKKLMARSSQVNSSGSDTRVSHFDDSKKMAVSKELENAYHNVDRNTRATIEQSLPDNLEEITAADANALAYKSMNYGIYAVTAAVIYIAEAYLAIVVTNIGDVFGFVGTFAGTSISYFIPSVLFCVGFSKFATADYKYKFGVWYKVAVLNGIVGVFFFSLFLYANILSLQG